MNITTAKVGRPKSSDPLVFVTVGLTRSQWQWLSLWLPGASPTSALRELFSRSMKFWPGGPFCFGHLRRSAFSTKCCGGGVE